MYIYELQRRLVQITSVRMFVRAYRLQKNAQTQNKECRNIFGYFFAKLIVIWISTYNSLKDGTLLKKTKW